MLKHKSPFVCARCGVAVAVWACPSDGQSYWKHQSGWRGKKSCGQKPIPIEREKYYQQNKGVE